MDGGLISNCQLLKCRLKILGCHTRTRYYPNNTVKLDIVFLWYGKMFDYIFMFKKLLSISAERFSQKCKNLGFLKTKY